MTNSAQWGRVGENLNCQILLACTSVNARVCICYICRLRDPPPPLHLGERGGSRPTEQLLSFRYDRKLYCSGEHSNLEVLAYLETTFFFSYCWVFSVHMKKRRRTFGGGLQTLWGLWVLKFGPCIKNVSKVQFGQLPKGKLFGKQISLRLDNVQMALTPTPHI